MNIFRQLSNALAQQQKPQAPTGKPGVADHDSKPDVAELSAPASPEHYSAKHTQEHVKSQKLVQETLQAQNKYGSQSKHYTSRKTTGKNGEDFACNFLKKKSYKILERNWRPPAGERIKARALELDIIAKDKDCIVFVEVKARETASTSNFKPQDNFTAAKCKNLLDAAKAYLNSNSAWGAPCRFDFIGIEFLADGTVNMEHEKNVISITETGNPLGGSHSTWQPW